jgi:threonine dehydrogenase-like Zn-dependent dehydrogenase
MTPAQSVRAGRAALPPRHAEGGPVRAIRFDGSQVVLEGCAGTPTPGPGEALVRLVRAAVSPADAAIAAGQRPGALKPAITLGHCFAGVVEDLDAGADKDLRKRWLGRRVTASPAIVCARCDLCRAGLQAHCRARVLMGLDAPGCFAEFFTAPLRNLHELPREVGDDQAVFAVPLAAAIHAAHRVRLEGKPYVTVLGDGAHALLAGQVMVRLNASVRVLGTAPDKFALCEKWGIKHRHLAEVGRRADQDIVVDCAGTPGSLALAMQLARPRAKIVLCVPRPQEDRPALAAAVEHEFEIVGAGAGAVPDALAALARAEVDVLPLITRRARLADGPAALLAAGDPGQIKVVIDP